MIHQTTSSGARRPGGRTQPQDEAEQRVAALRACPQLSYASTQTLQALVACMIRRSAPTGAILFWEGDASNSCLLLESGGLRLTAARADGRSHFMGEAKQLSLVGEISALAGTPRLFTATAVSPVTAWEIPAACLIEALRVDPHLAFAFVNHFLEQIVKRDSTAATRAGQCARERVVSAILDYVTPGLESATVLLTHEEIALMAGLSRESVSRALISLRRRNLVVTRRGQVVIQSVSALHAYGRSTRPFVDSIGAAEVAIALSS